MNPIRRTEGVLETTRKLIVRVNGRDVDIDSLKEVTSAWDQATTLRNEIDLVREAVWADEYAQRAQPNALDLLNGEQRKLRKMIVFLEGRMYLLSKESADQLKLNFT